ncbi:phosphoadenylyl-sulfate reductase [Hydrogenibacillus sp. N12]|uniref:phosphoadenylyl-sulfate reductase n=1 Tax=Hydrogenibacillus sp. N12 TaxID=2866627 RepID=UPI001C7CC196|nr:phosphoadenylyl-sulfate reductase [Hydrogenibacillus sp. N12]QZA34263.1 phosphoadenylyl-sulfate reductase [Hydrogenibacillus sp. N12]
MADLVLDPEEIRSLAETLRDAPPEEILRTALERIPRLALACSFGAEDLVILDLLMKIDPEASVFYLDTDLFFPETYALRDEAVRRYGIPNLRRIRPDLSLEAQAAEYGEALWSRDPDLCCYLRKVQPLEQVLAGLDGWITGIRREQAPTRARAEVFEIDGKFGVVKVNPLAYWTWDDVWNYIRAHDVPYNPLHDRGYPSIGCAPCTRPVQPGENLRAGRWSPFDKTECGLHG